MSKSLVLSLVMVSIAASGMSEEVFEEKKVEIVVVGEDPVVEETLKRSRDHVAELAHNDHTVMEKFDLFSSALLKAYSEEHALTVSEIQEISRAIDFAAEKHRFQTRKNKEKTPYISHPIGVAHHLVDIGQVRDPAVIIGALLHDTVEDTETTFEELQQKFGPVVTGYVKEMTDDKSLSAEMRKRMQVAGASHKSKGAAQIKMADKLYNVTDLLTNPPSDWSQTRIDQYFEWAQSVVNRLPKVNSSLRSAVEKVIDTYWESQAEEVQAQE